LEFGGDLGRMLLTRVGDVMIKDNLPTITKTSNMKDVIQIMTSGQLGTAIAVDSKQRVVGIITDGDLRRALNKYENIFELKAEDIMTKQPVTISKDSKLYEAQEIFNAKKIVTLIITDDKGKLQGVHQVHNL